MIEPIFEASHSSLTLTNVVFPFCFFFFLIHPAGNHAIGTVRKFPTLPLNPNGVWIDPGGGVWRQASEITKEAITDYAAVSSAPTLPLPDYER